jgi:hypothetical protein
VRLLHGTHRPWVGAGQCSFRPNKAAIYKSERLYTNLKSYHNGYNSGNR